MKKILTSLFIFVFAFLSFSASKVSAKIISDEKGTVTIAKNEVVNDDLFIGAQSVEIDGVVNGDVFIGAQAVKITGTINGNLHVGGNTLDLSGSVKGNVYAGAQTVLLSGSNIGGSLLVGAATVNLDKDSVIGGSVLAGAGSLSIDSQVKRSVYAGTGNLTIGSDAKIGKDLYYAAGNGNGQTSISEGAKIVGNTYKSEPNISTKSASLETAKKELPAVLNAFKFGSSIISLLGALIVGFLYFKFFNKDFVESSKLVTESFWKSLGVGFLVFIAFIPGLIILLVTIIGIPIAGLAFLMLLIYWYLAKIVVGSSLGTWIAKKFSWKTSVYGAFVLGLLAIYILKFIPVIGGISGLVVTWAGLGALTLRMLQKS